MFLQLAGPRMAKTGRPPKGAGNQGTTQVRVNDDLAAMLSELSLVHPKSTAQILDPLIREEVQRLYELYLPKITEAKAVKAAADENLKRIQDEAQKMATEPPAPKKPRKAP